MPAPGPQPLQQFQGLKKWVQQWNVLREEADDSITAAALNILAVQQSLTQFVDFSSQVTIGTQVKGDMDSKTYGTCVANR